MHVFVTGSTGLVGAGVVTALRGRGDRVTRIVRASPDTDDVVWSPATGQIDQESLAMADAVIHLAGENIAEGRWNAEKKARIRDSRIQGTTLLSEAIASLPKKPTVMISASAIGYYGERGEETCDESASAGKGFLAEVCRNWEAATRAAAEAGVRVVHIRIGVVLSTKGGALAKMLLPFKLGLGGRVGSGRQYWSWIALDDLLRAIMHCLDEASLSGPVNATSPFPVTNAEFTRTLGRVLKRPALLPMPAFAARLVLGEMANELLLASTRVHCRKLQESGFDFRYANLRDCLTHLLRKN
jgi:uncharacterized protein (TIGR01777 family)